MRPPRSAVPVALVGAVVWSGLFVTARRPMGPLGAVELLLALAPLVIVPLGLGLVQPAREDPARSPLALTLARRLQPIAASFAVASLVLPQGSRAAAGCALVWLLVPALCALAGASRFLERRARAAHTPGELAIDAALVYLPVGGAWWVAARAGWRIMGFDETLSALTAAHFHYAAFAAPLLTGLAQRALFQRAAAPDTDAAVESAPAARALSTVALCVVAGMAITAAGITATKFGAPRGFEFASALFTSASMTALAALGLTAVLPALARAPAHARTPTSARALLGLSFTSLFASMFLAALYAYGMVRGRALIDIPRMAQLHGSINALGFALCGLLGWTAARAALSPAVSPAVSTGDATASAAERAP